MAGPLWCRSGEGCDLCFREGLLLSGYRILGGWSAVGPVWCGCVVRGGAVAGQEVWLRLNFTKRCSLCHSSSSAVTQTDGRHTHHTPTYTSALFIHCDNIYVSFFTRRLTARMIYVQASL